MCRFAFSTAFLPEEKFYKKRIFAYKNKKNSKMQFTLKDLDPDKTVNDERFPKDFLIEVK